MNKERIEGKTSRRVKPKTQRRTKRFGGSFTPNEYRELTRLAKREKISKTELIIRAVKQYGLKLDE